MLAGQPDGPPTDRVAGQFMQYTSGTTGRPKAVQRALPSFDPETWVQVFSGNLLRYDIEPGGDAVHLVTSPMYHMSPLSFGYFSAHFEHPVVLMERWDAEEALRLIQRYRVTDTAMVPTQLHRLLQLPTEVRARYDVSSLRQVIHAAAPCPPELKRRLFDWLGPVIYEFYGATEGGGTIAKPQDWLAHPGTVGRPWQGAEVKILDDDGHEVPPGTVGTVYMKLMGGDFRYKGDPEKTTANRRGDFFTVGDMGELDEDGFLYLRDRKIDMIISGGVNIYPAEVEAALLSHRAVGDAAVFGIPDEAWGADERHVIDLSTLAPDAIALLEGGEQAIDAAREHLAITPQENWTELEQVTLCSPVPRPGTIRETMCFEAHIINCIRLRMGPLDPLDERLARLVGTRRSLAGRLNSSFYQRPPYYKANPRSVVGTDTDVRIPPYTKQFDYELEWGVYIGKQGTDIPVDRAHEYIGGYTIFNDFSARDTQQHEMRGRLGPAKGKDFDTGNAIGPWLVTPDEIPDPYNLTMTARVDGEEWSRGNSGETSYRFDELIAYMSRSETLYPGDFIGSGTCSGRLGKGCGLEGGPFLTAGNIVELEVEHIGVLRNRVISTTSRGRPGPKKLSQYLR